MPRTVTDVPFGLRLFVWLTESFGRLAATTVVVGATLTMLELGVLVAFDFAALVVLATAVVATVDATVVATVVTTVSTVSIVVVTVVTVVTDVSLAD